MRGLVGTYGVNGTAALHFALKVEAVPDFYGVNAR